EAQPGATLVCQESLVLQRHVRQLSMAQVIIFQELKSFLRISIRTWLMDQNPCETSHFLAIGVVTQRCSTRQLRNKPSSGFRHFTLASTNCFLGIQNKDLTNT